jgi:hypothetical protein
MTRSPSSSSSNGPESAGCFLAINDLLDRLHANWTLIGAVAAASYRASQRPTDDVDYLVEWDDRLVPGLVDAGFDVRLIEDQGDPQMIRAERSDGRADIVIAATEYQRIAVARASEHVLTVEDVLIHKLIAWRPRDQDDVSSILSTELAFDEEYVAHWAREWGVEERWNEARSRR